MKRPTWWFGDGGTDSPRKPATVAVSVIAAVYLLIAGLAGVAASLRVLDRAASVIAVAALLTAGLLLPAGAQNGDLGRRMWKVGAAAAWVWLIAAGTDILIQMSSTDPTTDALSSWETYLRLGHVVLIGVTAVLATLFEGNPSTRRAAVAAAVAAVLLLPSAEFENLPWQARTNDAAHAAASITWLAGLLGVLCVGLVRIDSSVTIGQSAGGAANGRVKGLRAYRAGHMNPPDPAYENLKHAANQFSNLALVSLVVLVSGTAMVLGAAQYAGDGFLQDPWAWLAMIKVGLTTVALGCAALHRTISLKLLNGEQVRGWGAIILRIIDRLRSVLHRGTGRRVPTTGDGAPARPRALIFQRLAVVEVGALLLAGALGTSMNLMQAPKPSPTPTAVTIEVPAPGCAHSPLIAKGSANLQPDSQLWLVVEDIAAGTPYYLSTDAPVAVDRTGRWETRVTLGSSEADVDRDFRLTAIVVADRYFDEAIAARPQGQYSVRLADYPDGVQVSVDVTVCTFDG